MCRNFPKLLMAPAEAIASAKKKASYGDALGTLIIDGIVMAIAAAVLITQSSGMLALGNMFSQGLGMATIGMFVLIFVGGLFFALMVKLVVNTLGGEGSYLHGLTTSAYCLAAPAVGFLITAVVYPVQYAGPIIGMIALTLGIALGVATLYRSMKELFATDMVTSLVAFGVLMLSLGVAMAFVSPMLGVSSAALAGIA